MAGDTIVVVEDLKKTFKIGFTRKVVEAVRGISFDVKQGEIFGFLGPNGAGKTTTIKIMMDLIRPTGGKVRLFGLPPSDTKARSRVGYLPEQPWFYDCLTAVELLDFFGGIYGIERSERKKKIGALLSLVGLSGAGGRPLRSFSKGMLQRIGLAQALIGDPELVVLDEPLAGLDPIGRKEFKDIIAEVRSSGKTVFFSSHILADIELLCDRIAIIDKGKLRYVGPLRDFVLTGQKEVEVVASRVPKAALEVASKQALRVELLGERVKLVLPRDISPGIVRDLAAAGADIEGVTPRSETLEEIFVRMAAARG